jgi:hypothetical protein
MVDERGRDKNQICIGGRRAENEMRDNSWFILSARASHFRSVSKTVSIPEDLGHRCDWRSYRSRRGILDMVRKFWRTILGCTRFLIGCHNIPLWSDHDHDLVALFITLRFECERLLLSADVELDDPSCNINRAPAVLKNGLSSISGV